jgi:hypothetical protein
VTRRRHVTGRGRSARRHGVGCQFEPFPVSAGCGRAGSTGGSASSGPVGKPERRRGLQMRTGDPQLRPGERRSRGDGRGYRAGAGRGTEAARPPRCGRGDLARRPGGLGAAAMLSFPAAIKVYLCTVPCDMRRSFDGLSMLADHVIGCNPFSGHLLVFSNRRSAYA